VGDPNSAPRSARVEPGPRAGGRLQLAGIPRNTRRTRIGRQRYRKVDFTVGKPDLRDRPHGRHLGSATREKNDWRAHPARVARMTLERRKPGGSPWDAVRSQGWRAPLTLESREARRRELGSDTSRRGSSVKGRACTFFFHAETRRAAADVAVMASSILLPPDLFGARRGVGADGDAKALAKVLVIRLLVLASAGAGARHREVTARGSAGKASGGRRGGEAISPGNEVGYFFSARTISRRVIDRSAPRRPSGRRGRLWQGGTCAAARRESLASDRSWVCASGTFTPRVRRASRRQRRRSPSNQPGARKVQLDPESKPGRPRSSRRVDGSVRDRCRSHSSFVDGRDKHLDVISRQGIAPSFTPRPRLASTAARGHEWSSKGADSEAKAPTGSGVFGRRAR
jgi:hypothetical protein